MATDPKRAPSQEQAAGTGAAFFALVFTAIHMAPAIAHLAALPNKIDMGQQAYFAAQQVYAGWMLFVMAFALAVAGNLWLALARRRQREATTLALAAVVLLLFAIGVFFGWVYPANVATLNWFSVPSNWSALRSQWEYGHAAVAVFSFAAFCCTALAALSGRR